MKPQKRYMYINRFTGDALPLTKAEGKKLNEDWSRAKVIKNDKGERVYRFELQGATVDISEVKPPKGVAADGKSDTK